MTPIPPCSRNLEPRRPEAAYVLDDSQHGFEATRTLTPMLGSVARRPWFASQALHLSSANDDAEAEAEAEAGLPLTFGLAGKPELYSGRCRRGTGPDTDDRGLECRH